MPLSVFVCVTGTVAADAGAANLLCRSMEEKRETRK